MSRSITEPTHPHLEGLPERVLALLAKHGGWQATLDHIEKLEAALAAGADLDCDDRRGDADFWWTVAAFRGVELARQIERAEAAEAALAALPGGGDWVLVPRQMRLTPDALAHIAFMCGGDEDATENDERWNAGILWVGETEGDHGEKYYGLNIACEECLEEGSIPVCEFPALPTPTPHEADQ